MDIKIIVAAHKAYTMPEQDIYLPLQVGAAGKEDIGYTRDDSGDHISEKNPYYCELTGLYWLWKNVDAEYYGLVHYRRLFLNPGVIFRKVNPYRRVLDRRHLENLLKSTDVIMPKKRHYFIESIYSHYEHTHYKEHLDITREIIKNRSPEYLTAFDRTMHSRKAHMFNMMIMGKSKFRNYCSWLFPILEELEQNIDPRQYDAFQARYVGRVSEILLNVWMDRNQYHYIELPVVMMGKVDWGRKVKAFLRAKFKGEKYNQGF